MRYLVTVETQIFHTQEVSVEAATESEASHSAIAFIKSRARGDIRQLDVLNVKEDPKPDRNISVLNGEGYIKRLL